MWHAIALTPGWTTLRPVALRNGRVPWDRSTCVVGQRHYALTRYSPTAGYQVQPQHFCMPVGKGRLQPFAC